MIIEKKGFLDKQSKSSAQNSQNLLSINSIGGRAEKITYRIARSSREHGNHATAHFNGWLHDRRVVLRKYFRFH